MARVGEQLRLIAEGCLFARFQRFRIPRLAGTLGVFPPAICRLRSMSNLRLFLSIIALSLVPNFAAGQGPPQGNPQINVPYRCANGITYTILVCKPYRADQWCQWREDQNGQTVTTVNSTWSSMTGRLQGCAVVAAPASLGTNAAPPPLTQAAVGSQQVLNPPYLKEFPSVDQVMAQTKGSDAKDTLNRQMASFLQLKKILEDLAGPRWLRGQFTPDEARIHGNYDLAYNNLAKPLNFPDDGYFAMPSFVASLFNTFPMPTVQSQWLAQNAQLAARVKASHQPMQGQPSAGSDTSGTSQDVRPLPATDDPGQLAIRRCAELGGTMLGCIGTGMGTDMSGMMGVNLSTLGHSYKAGLVIFGTYTAASGLSFGFSDSNVNIGGCGRMVQGAHNYAVTAAGGKYTLNIANTPQPLVVTLGADGKIAGPAAQDITGQQVTGYHVVTNLRTGMEVSRTPIYGPITVHCNVGTLKPGPPTDPSPASASVASGILTVMQNLTGTESSTAQQQQLLPPGPRMAGAFGGAGGLRIQFSDANAVIDCAQAHVKIPYDVANQEGGAVIRLQNGSNPFSLRVQSDGSLATTGTVIVNGKLMIGMRGSDPVFKPTTATCSGNALVAVSHP